MYVRRSGWSAAALSAVLGGAGILHFAAPNAYEATVPRWLPRRRAIVYASGVAELSCAVGLWISATRRPAALASAGLFIAVFPANVQMAVDGRQGPSRARCWLAYGRLPLQAPLVWWALRVANTRHCVTTW